MKYVSFNEYVKEILKTAIYKEDKEIGCVVAIAPFLKGCMSQGANFEDARDNLIDAIEVWIMAGLMEGELMPEVNGSELIIAYKLQHPTISEVVNA
ncbi:MAG: type II toxin-antitoxin system HicB family antitoxin [Desulfobacterales bacterium]|nr:type II toxin-antitoxin system HicB family antitoxin [Desulfobacterales bacterium]